MKNKKLILGVIVFSFLVISCILFEIQTRNATTNLSKMGYDTVTDFNLPFYPLLIFESEPVILFLMVVFIIGDIIFIRKIIIEKSSSIN